MARDAERLPSRDILDSLFNYCEITGYLYWKQGGKGRRKGPAGSVDYNGYRRVLVQGRKCMVHRIVYKMATGVDPVYIDHINGNKDDNTLSNLRSVSTADNNRNYRIGKQNRSGCLGVSKTKRVGKWYASIKVDGVSKNLGYYSDKFEAICARKAAENKYGFHKNHGRAAS